MQILSKRTTDVTDQEIAGIYALFESVFHKHREISTFRNQFCNTTKGYSYHAIALDDSGRVVGHNAYVPFTYLKNGSEPFMLVLSIDAMIDPECRGKGLYRKLLETCEAAAVADGCKIRVGFPNDNSYPVQIKGFKYTDIGRLSTYILPVRVGAVKQALKIVNPLSRLFCGIMCLLSQMPGGRKVYSFPLAKDRKDFDVYRYKWFDGDYKIVEENGVKYVYKTADYQGIPATFLLDVYPLSRRNFDLAVRGICRQVKDLGLLFYVGNLPFTPLSMLRIPHIIEPKNFHFVGKVLDPEFFVPVVPLNIKNWELNLSNYDLL